MNKNTVRVIRLYYGLSQVEFAKRIGVSQQLVSHVESGAIEISPKTKVKILKEFPITPEIIDIEGAI